jgi:COP9 signalosome complex subunit 4
MAASQLQKVSNIADKDEKIEAYKTLLTQLFEKQDAPSIKEAVRHIVSASTIISRPVLKEVVDNLKKSSPQLHKDVAVTALEILGQGHSVQFEEQISDINYNLAKVYIKEGEGQDLISAARFLQAIPLETGQRNYPVEKKVKIWVMIAQLFLEEEKPFEAERFINKAAPLTGQIKNEKLLLKYKSAFVRNQDFNRKFSEAALSYYRLQLPNQQDRIQALEAGVRCAVLSPAGPQRSRLLAMYYKDDKAPQLDSYTVLEKMFLERILKKEEIQAFSNTLLPHQKAIMSGGKTILEQAVIEHNLLAASKVYNNITFDELATLLDVTPDLAEKIASKMISEERLVGSINQTARLLYFKDVGTVNELVLWDHHIEYACSCVNSILDKISKKYPQLITHE